MRLAWCVRAALLVLIAAVGCQSGVQTDLVTRELRTQEDQIYALEDYLAQYQQLVCQYRSENAELKRRLAEAEGGDTLPAPSSPKSPAANGRRPRPNGRPQSSGPSFQSPGRTPVREQEGSELEMEIIEPDVPPLEETTSDDAPPELFPASYDEVVVQAPSASAQAEAFEPQGPVAVTSLAKLFDESPESPAFVHVRGAVVSNDTGGGPRLQVDLEPLTAEFEPTQFMGRVSIVVIDPEAEDQAPLAAWEFTSDDAQPVFAELPSRCSMRYCLELPADKSINPSTELWVRLMTDGGEPVVSHVGVDLTRLGEFASLAGGTTTREEIDELLDNGSPAAFAEPVECVVLPTFDAHDSGWTVARPDRPGRTSEDAGAVSSQWRASTEPIPVAVAQTATEHGVEFQSSVRQAAALEPMPSTDSIRPRRRRSAPRWSPDRAAGESNGSRSVSPGNERPAGGLKRPVWSAER